MGSPLEHKRARTDHEEPGVLSRFWDQFQYLWECENDELDDIWLEWESWTEPACGFIPSVLMRYDLLTEGAAEDPELSLRVHMVALD